MAKYFEGTSTGNRYEVGRDYKTGDGRVMTANSDGSFTQKGHYVGTTDAGKTITDDRGRGNTSRGSFGNPDVSWYASGRDRANPNQHGATGIIAYSQGKDGSYAAERDGEGHVVTQAQNPARMRAAGGYTGAAVRTAAWSGDQTEPQDLLLGGNHMKASPKWSNADLAEIRYSDIGGNLIGLMNLGADIGHNLAWAMGPEYYKADAGGRVQMLAGKARDGLAAIAGPVTDFDLGAATRGWNGATPSEVREPDRMFHDGWVSYDEGTTWAFEGISNPWR